MLTQICWYVAIWHHLTTQKQFVLSCVYIFYHFQTLNGADSWNPSSWKTRACSSNIVNAMVTVDLVKQGANASAAIILTYRQTSHIRRTLLGNKIVDHSDVVGAPPFISAPTTFSTWHLASIYCTKTTTWWDEENLSFQIWCVLYLRFCGSFRIFPPQHRDCLHIEAWWYYMVIYLGHHYNPASTKLKGGYTCFMSSVRLSVCGQNRVRSVSSTILVGSISYLHILSSNFRRCVACKEFLEFVTLTLSFYDMGPDVNH